MTEDIEALEWLKNNKNESALATNRFSDTPTAISFVEKLYSLGASKVLIGEGIRDEPDRVASEGGPYADSLVVYLPEDTESRKKLLDIVNEENDDQGFEHEEDTGNEFFNMWWD